MKRVLVVITTAFVPTGGLTSVMMNYYRVIDKHQFHVDFLSTNTPPESLLSELRQQESRYYQLPPRVKRMPAYFLQLTQRCKEYDVVHIHGNSRTTMLELLAAKRAGVRNIVIHNHTSRTSHPYINKLLAPFFKGYHAAIACSKEAGEWLFGNEFTILRNAIDLRKYVYHSDERTASRKAFSIQDDEFVYGHVGKIYEPKNHHFLLDIFAVLHQRQPQSKLLLVGDGVLRAQVEAHAKELNIYDAVIFAGMRTDVPQMLQAMDAFIFPSLWEGLPLSVLEAQATGLRCFLSDHISRQVAVTPSVQFLSLNDTAQHWATFIQDHLPPVDRSTLCTTNQQQMTQAGFNIQTEAKQLEKIYAN